MLFASGDEGANCGDGNKYIAETPGSSPWVTAVGGTGGSSPGQEFAIGLSSGGFSSRWPQPAWQADAVKAYMASNGSHALPPKSRGYDTTKRGYPDIAAQDPTKP